METEMEHNQINRIVIKGVWVAVAMGGSSNTGSNNTSSNTSAQTMKEGDKGKGAIWILQIPIMQWRKATTRRPGRDRRGVWKGGLL